MSSWVLFTLLALLMFGLWGIFGKIATLHIDPKSALVYNVIGATTIAIITLLLIGLRPAFNLDGLIFSILTGMAGTLGVLFFLMALSSGRASVVVTLSALYPVVTIALSFLVLKEPLTIKHGIGMLLALAAIYLLSS